MNMRTDPGTYECFVIAEAGVNHNGDVDLALRLVDVAADAGADAVKFQTYRADEIASANAPKAAYQVTAADAGESQREMLERLELPIDAYDIITDRCRSRGIEFMSTGFDIASLRMLVERVGIQRIKIPSGEITNGPLLLAAARSGLPIILSTGMSDLDEIEHALSVIAFGSVESLGHPDEKILEKMLEQPDAYNAVRNKVTVLQCTSQYPAPVAKINLRAMETIAGRFGTAVGLSDHSAGIIVPIIAAARGATMVEKHITTDRNLSGPDHAASIEPEELAEMIGAVRTAELSLGTGEKRPTPSEKNMRLVARRSLVAVREIVAGETFDTENLAARRPGGGLSPMQYWKYLGRKATRNYAADEQIDP
jgi:N-acetylneuraminate synthase